MGFSGGSGVKNPSGDMGLIPGSGRSPGERNGNPLQYSCLGNPGQWNLVGYSPWGCKRVGHDLATKHTPSTKRQGNLVQVIRPFSASASSSVIFKNPLIRLINTFCTFF